MNSPAPTPHSLLEPKYLMDRGHINIKFYTLCTLKPQATHNNTNGTPLPIANTTHHTHFEHKQNDNIPFPPNKSEMSEH